MKKVFVFLYFFFFTGLLCSVTAFAYIDPSAMTYIIQLIAGIAIAAGAGIGYYLRRLKRKFSKHGKSSSHAAQYTDADDDDDIGYGDYELDSSPEPQQMPSPAAQASYTQPAAQASYARPADPVYAYTPEPVNLPVDPYDESGGEGSLAAENRELRRLLAEERQKVEELKRALHICTAPRR